MIKTALVDKLAHVQRARGAGHGEYSMEFSDLLDEIVPEQTTSSTKPEFDPPRQPAIAPRFADPTPPVPVARSLPVLRWLPRRLSSRHPFSPSST